MCFYPFCSCFKLLLGCLFNGFEALWVLTTLKRKRRTPMEQKPSCSPVSEPKDMHWDSIDFSKFILLFGVGSFALDGPVLLALGFLGDKEAENNTLVHLRLTPFNQEAKLIGSFNDRSFFQTDEVFSLFNHLGTQYPPSLLLGSTVFEDHFIQTFFTRYFQWRNDGFLVKGSIKLMSGCATGISTKP